MEWINQVISLAALAVGSFILTRLRRPRDHERAALLSTIARGAAALVVSLNPTAAWPALLAQVVNQIASAAGVPTQNTAAIQRAASEALATLGKLP